MWGVSRSQSSYNSGVTEGSATEAVKNQRKFRLPFNEISATLYYNQRMIVSAPLSEPITWRVSKIENTAPRGINMLTLLQDKFDQHKDYIERDEEGNVIGMWADYHAMIMEPTDQEIDLSEYSDGIILYNGSKPQLKIGGSEKTLTFQCDDIEPYEIKWSFQIDGQNIDSFTNNPVIVTSSLDDVNLTNNQIKVRVIDDEDFLGTVLKVVAKTNSASAFAEFEIIGI